MRPFLLSLALLLAGAAAAQQSPYSGSFSDGQVTLTLERGPDGFSGFLELSGARYPLTAQLSGTTLNGTFEAAGSAYAFTATLDGSRLLLASGGTSYTLERLARAAPEPANPTAVAPPETQTLDVEPFRQYQAGTRVRYGPLGVSFVVPSGWTGALNDASGFVLTATGRQGGILALAQAGATADDMAAYLSTPQFLGGGVVGRPLGPARTAGNQVRQSFQADAMTGQAISVHGEAGNGVLLLAFGPAALQAEHGAALEAVAASVRLEAHQALAGMREWTEGLSGRRLYLFDYQSSNVLDATEQSSYTREASWHLCSDGRYATVEGTESYIGPQDRRTPGSDQGRGRWKVIVLGNLPHLLLTSDANTWETLALGFDGRNVYLAGSQVSVSQSEACP